MVLGIIIGDGVGGEQGGGVGGGGGDELELRNGWLERYWRDINFLVVLISVADFDFSWGV